MKYLGWSAAVMLLILVYLGLSEFSRGSVLIVPAHVILMLCSIASVIAWFGLAFIFRSIEKQAEDSRYQKQLKDELRKRPRLSSYDQKTETIMKENNRLAFYILYHIVMGTVIALGITFFLLHGESMRPELNVFQEIWRTLSYRFPPHANEIAIATGILIGFSFAIYGLVFRMNVQRSGVVTGLYVVALLLSLGGFAATYGRISPVLFGFILVPALVQCAILFAIDRNKKEQKAKPAL